MLLMNLGKIHNEWKQPQGPSAVCEPPPGWLVLCSAGGHGGSPGPGTTQSYSTGLHTGVVSLNLAPVWSTPLWARVSLRWHLLSTQGSQEIIWFLPTPLTTGWSSSKVLAREACGAGGQGPVVDGADRRLGGHREGAGRRVAQGKVSDSHLFVHKTVQILQNKDQGCFLIVMSLPMGRLGFPGGSNGKSACIVGDQGSIPGLGRSVGEGNGYPLQYSCLENPRDRGAWWATKSIGPQTVGHCWSK